MAIASYQLLIRRYIAAASNFTKEYFPLPELLRISCYKAEPLFIESMCLHIHTGCPKSIRTVKKTKNVCGWLNFWATPFKISKSAQLWVLNDFEYLGSTYTFEIEPATPISSLVYCSDTQCPEVDFNKVSNTIHKTYLRLTSMPQRFQKYIAWNPSK